MNFRGFFLKFIWEISPWLFPNQSYFSVPLLTAYAEYILGILPYSE